MVVRVDFGVDFDLIGLCFASVRVHVRKHGLVLIWFDLLCFASVRVHVRKHGLVRVHVRKHGLVLIWFDLGF